MKVLLWILTTGVVVVSACDDKKSAGTDTASTDKGETVDTASETAETADTATETGDTIAPSPLEAVPLAAGSRHACALRADHTVACWGANDKGQLGDGSVTSATAPVAVKGLAGVTAIAAAEDYSCALKEGGAVWCWGYAPAYAAPIGPGPRLPALEPTEVPVVSEVVALSTAATEACALRADHTALCWGSVVT